VIFVDRIEPVLPFWTERLGFTATVEVPGRRQPGVRHPGPGQRRGDVSEPGQRDQGCSALAAEPFVSRANLFIEVENLQEFLPGLEGLQVTVPKRTTFYGALEFGVRAPCGTNVVLAEFQGQ
jgi:hypothetical protein